jgi:hypothetical protein
MSTASDGEATSVIDRFERLLRIHELCSRHLPSQRAEIDEIFLEWSERLTKFSERWSMAQNYLRVRGREFTALKTHVDANPQGNYSEGLARIKASAEESFRKFSEPIQSEIRWLKAVSISGSGEGERPSDSVDPPSNINPRTQTPPASTRSQQRDSLLAEYKQVCERETAYRNEQTDSILQALREEDAELSRELENLGVPPDSHSAPVDDRSRETVQTNVQSQKEYAELEAEAEECKAQLTKLQDRVFPNVRALTNHVRQRLAELAGVAMTDGDVWAEMNENFATIQQRFRPKPD